MAGAAYCSIDQIASWNVGQHAINGVVPTRVFSNDTLQYWVGYDTVGKTVISAVRGSASTANWLDNLEFVRTYPYKDKNIGVHDGFHKEYVYLRDSMVVAIKEAMKISGYKTITPVGHSSGGANAVLLGYEIGHENLIPGLTVKQMNTYGCPRVGNQAFVDAFHNLGFVHDRVTHYHDIVPHVPEESFGYVHTRGEVWYDEPSDNYKVCSDLNGEDKTCSNSCGPLSCTSIDDHLTYLKIYLSGCKDGFKEGEEIHLKDYLDLGGRP